MFLKIESIILIEVKQIKILYKIIFKLVNATKPVLVKILPIEMLRERKRKMIGKVAEQSSKNVQGEFDKNNLDKGINLIGFIRGEIGLGQSCRLVATAIENSEIDYTIYNFNQVSSMRQSDTSFDYKITNSTPYGVNIFHINPPDMLIANVTLDRKVWRGHYNIGFWLWELEKFPEDWNPAFSLVDEIWTPAEYVSNIIRKKTNLPVKTMVYPLETPTDERFNRDYFGLPEDKFLYLTMYDCNSTMQRKNPVAAIEAFKKAFDRSDERVGIVIKVNNPQKEDLDLISNLVNGYKNVYIITDILTKIEVNSLIKNVDVLISLHRAEGFGLPIAEAMLLGTATIATNWSANTEFTNEETSGLVGYDLVELKEDYAMYKKGAFWAEPHIDEASALVEKFYSDVDYYETITENGKKLIMNNYNKEVAGKAIDRRIYEIYGGKA